jgi:hypothetical protein
VQQFIKSQINVSTHASVDTNTKDWCIGCTYFFVFLFIFKLFYQFFFFVVLFLVCLKLNWLQMFSRSGQWAAGGGVRLRLIDIPTHYKTVYYYIMFLSSSKTLHFVWFVVCID